jgi:hypothetical protein
MQKVSKKQQQADSIARLREWIDPKEGIVIIIKSVSRSGMQRGMEVYTRDLDACITYHVGHALGWGFTKDNHVKVGGCGMDMRFHLAYSLTHTLYSEEERKELTGNGSGCLPYKTL